MPQLAYTTLMPIGIAGELADASIKTVLSPLCSVEAIQVAAATAKVIGADYQVKLPSNNLATLTFSGVLVTSNVVNGTVAGVALSPTTFATDSPTTMGVIAGKIAAVTGVASAVVDGTGLIITITMLGSTAAAVTGFVVTAGAGQATVAMVNSTLDTLFGVALLDEGQMNGWTPTGSTGPVAYQVGQPVANMSQGHVLVAPEDTVTSDSPVYVRFIDGGTGKPRGNFASSAHSGTCFLVPSSVAVWLKGGSPTVPAVLSIFNVQ